MMTDKLNNVVKRMVNDHYLPGHGWDDILVDLDRKLSSIDPDYTIAQIKEKFGTLRYYFDTSINNSELRDAMKAYVRIAELRSAEICELCGDNGKLRTELMWRKTLCDGCYPEKSGYNRNSKSEQKDVI